jgi:hypothetical protein
MMIPHLKSAIAWHSTPSKFMDANASTVLYQVDDAMQSHIQRHLSSATPPTINPTHHTSPPPVLAPIAAAESIITPLQAPLTTFILHPSHRHITQSP